MAAIRGFASEEEINTIRQAGYELIVIKPTEEGEYLISVSVDADLTCLLEPWAATYLDLKQGCPSCGHDNSVGEGVEIEGVWAHQRCECLNCGTTRTDRYRLVFQTEIVTDEPPEELLKEVLCPGNG